MDGNPNFICLGLIAPNLVIFKAGIDDKRCKDKLLPQVYQFSVKAPMDPYRMEPWQRGYFFRIERRIEQEQFIRSKV